MNFLSSISCFEVLEAFLGNNIVVDKEVQSWTKKPVKQLYISVNLGAKNEKVELLNFSVLRWQNIFSFHTYM